MNDYNLPDELIDYDDPLAILIAREEAEENSFDLA